MLKLVFLVGVLCCLDHGGVTMRIAGDGSLRGLVGDKGGRSLEVANRW